MTARSYRSGTSYNQPLADRMPRFIACGTRMVMVSSPAFTRNPLLPLGITTLSTGAVTSVVQGCLLCLSKGFGSPVAADEHDMALDEANLCPKKILLPESSILHFDRSVTASSIRFE
ncbi:hypothetical protein BDV11DRAFT_198427 [Aspergillus similis]